MRYWGHRRSAVANRHYVRQKIFWLRREESGNGLQIWKNTDEEIFEVPEKCSSNAPIHNQQPLIVRAEITFLIMSRISILSGHLWWQAERMLRNIRTAMKMAIENIDWMDNATKAAALLKLADMRQHVGYPEEHVDDEDWIMNDYLNVSGPQRESYCDACCAITFAFCRQRWMPTLISIMSYHYAYQSKIASYANSKSRSTLRNGQTHLQRPMRFITC